MVMNTDVLRIVLQLSDHGNTRSEDHLYGA